MDLSRTVSEINSDFGFLYPVLRAFNAHAEEFVTLVKLKKLGRCPYQRVAKFGDMCIHLDTIPQSVGRTDRRKKEKKHP